MRYDNEKCPVCNTEFKDGDNIVVCPECGAPHHKECWTQHGECFFKELHGDGFAWSGSGEEKAEAPELANPFESAEQESQVKHCPNCGAENSKDAVFCAECHVPFIFSEEEAGQTPGDIFIDGERISGVQYVDGENSVSVADAGIYIGRNRGKYIKSFLKGKFTKGKFNFNFAALIFGPYWFFYRKIYSIGAMFAGVQVGITLFLMSVVNRCFPDALNYISGLYSSQTTQITAEMYEKYNELFQKGVLQHPYLSKLVYLIPLLYVVANIVAGFLADKLYLRKIKSDSAKIKSVAQSEGMYKSYMYARGGTSFLMAVICAVAVQSFIDMIMML